MKKISSILSICLMALLMLGSCSKEHNEMLTGKWKSTQQSYTIYYGYPNHADGDTIFSNDIKIWVFYSDNTLRCIDNGEEHTYDFTLDGNDITIKAWEQTLTINHLDDQSLVLEGKNDDGGKRQEYHMEFERISMLD